MFEEVFREFNDPRRYFVVPGGLRDVHVHFRDPGQPEAETRATGAAAAASHWLVFQADASSAAVRTPAAPHVFPAGQPAAMPAPAQSARASPIIVFMFMLSLSPV